MSEDFARDLRARIDVIAPTIAVDTTGVVRAARRRRTARRSGVVLLAVVAVGGAAWAPMDRLWTVAVPPAQPDPHGVVATQDEPTPTPTVSPSDAVVVDGWPDAKFWYVSTEIVQGGEVHHEESWLGHTDPGMLVSEGNLDTYSGIGPSAWGTVTIDGAEVLVSWDVLYTLPTDPTELEALLRGSLQPDRGSGTDDDKVLDAVHTMLFRSPASPALRAALWSIAAGLPGTVVVPASTDSTGRAGTAIEFTAGELAGWRWVVDTATLAPLEEAGTDGHTAYLESRPSDTEPLEPTLESSGCVAWATC
ncbi:hypothetical protein [Cellulomonas sp. URHE0023]|uniref:hypothetical protein n=1 Tax=Cellulomonas sp. URHE0023 TaxID=1380354 RepID=UPI000488F124|nr:hypothetical protein [Cellulomonas sp. URHE0023]